MHVVLRTIAETWLAMDELVHDYYDRGGEHVLDGMPPLAMHWEKFMDLERSGNTLLVQAYEEDKLVGFVLYIVMPHVHHDTTIASCNTLATHLDHRGKGIGRLLMKAAELLLRDKSVTHVTHGYRVTYADKEPLFPKLGYKLIEHVYMKELV